MAHRLRLGQGSDILESWTEGASVRDTNAMAAALFSLVERTVYHQYPVIDDSTLAREFVVVVRDDLAIRVRLEHVEKFSVLFVGTPAAALELGRAAASAA
jgi:hypothetical protein